MTRFEDAAAGAAQRLEAQYRAAGIFDHDLWFGGNALHAYLRALLAVGRPDESRLLEYAYRDVFAELARGPGWWRDDYAWWGCAFCLALRNRDALGYVNPGDDELWRDLGSAATACWQKLEENWRDSAYSAVLDNSVAGADITGGAFNTGPDDPVPPMSGRNTVTNAGFWLLSFELRVISDDPAYGERVAALGSWFDAWFAFGTGADATGLMNPDGLILERPTGNATVPEWYWSGDQGVVMIDLLRQVESEWPPPYTSSRAAKLAVAVIDTMCTDGILEENLDFTARLDQFLVDYATGKGILMRHLGDVCHALGGEWTESTCGAFLRANAAAVWRTRNPENGQLRFNWNPAQPEIPITGKSEELCELVLQASGLDALSAAARFWPAVDIDAPSP